MPANMIALSLNDAKSRGASWRSALLVVRARCRAGPGRVVRASTGRADRRGQPADLVVEPLAGGAPVEPGHLDDVRPSPLGSPAPRRGAAGRTASPSARPARATTPPSATPLPGVSLTCSFTQRCQPSKRIDPEPVGQLHRLARAARSSRNGLPSALLELLQSGRCRARRPTAARRRPCRGRRGRRAARRPGCSASGNAENGPRSMVKAYVGKNIPSKPSCSGCGVGDLERRRTTRSWRPAAGTTTGPSVGDVAVPSRDGQHRRVAVADEEDADPVEHAAAC